MTHLTDEQLILRYYGEARDASSTEAHLRDCADCARAYAEMAGALALVPTDAPERDERYGLEVWQRIRHQLPQRRRWAWWVTRVTDTRWRAVGALLAAAALAVVAFTAGRYSQSPAGAPAASRVPVAVGQAPADVNERVRLAALADHLAQSERVLLEVINAQGARAGRIDMSAAQGWADDLIDANRLYRDAALQAGDRASASVLDDVERSLLDIVHAPAQLTPAQLRDVDVRIDAAALLFKLRVLSTTLQDDQSQKPGPGDSI